MTNTEPNRESFNDMTELPHQSVNRNLIDTGSNFLDSADSIQSLNDRKIRERIFGQLNELAASLNLVLTETEYESALKELDMISRNVTQHAEDGEYGSLFSTNVRKRPVLCSMPGEKFTKIEKEDEMLKEESSHLSTDASTSYEPQITEPINSQTLNDREKMSAQLNKLFVSLSPNDYIDSLKALTDIYRNVSQPDKEEQHCQIKLTDETFTHKVWRHPTCQELMKMTGWVEEDDHVRLRDDSNVHIAAQLLESLCKETQTTKITAMKCSSIQDSSTSSHHFDSEAHAVQEIVDAQPACHIVEEPCTESRHSRIMSDNQMQEVSHHNTNRHGSDDKHDITLSGQFEKFAASLSPKDLEASLSILKKIFKNIIEHPNDDKYRQIKLANKTFSNKVWRYPACEELMKMSGWVVEDDCVRLRDDSCVPVVSQLLESPCNRAKTTGVVSTQSTNCFTTSNTNPKIPCDADLGRDSTEADDTIMIQIINLFSLLSLSEFEGALKALNNIYQNVVQHGRDKQYYQIKLTDKAFSNKVWSHPACQTFMEINGWVVDDDHITLTDDSHAHILAQHLASFIQEINTAGSHPQSSQSEKSFKSKTRSNEKILVAPKPVSYLIISAIFSGSAYETKLLLSKIFDVSAIKIMHVSWTVGTENAISLIDVAYAARQIGIARILINEYLVDPNGLGKNRPNYSRLFVGCDSSEACQSLIIEFIREFKLEVGLCDTVGSAIHYAILFRHFTVVKFLVEDCKVNINQTFLVDNYSGSTALHMAYGLNEIEMANYLIEHGADENVIDYNGKRPRDYQFGNDDDFYYGLSTKYRRLSKLYRDIKSKEYQYIFLMLERGTEFMEAVNLTYEKFPELNDEFTSPQPCHNLETVPTMKELNHYITDMAPVYYSIGLELDVRNSQLKIIERDVTGIKQKCRAMLEVWLENDTSATWKKLCTALQEPAVGLCDITEQIKKYLEAI